MSTYSYVMKGVSKALPGGRLLFKDIWLSFFPGAKIGVVGVNGAGKSTLLKIMAGQDKEFSGEAWASDGLKVGYLPQEPSLDPTMTVKEAIFSGLTGLGELLEAFEAISTQLMHPLSDDELQACLDQQSHLQEKIEAMGGWEADHRVETLHAALGCPPLERTVETLSGGEKRRVALCRLLIQQPDMLLLDEPTNHLDTQAIASLEKFLQDYKGTVVLITHDRYFLDNVVSWILELDRGQGFPFEGHYSQWLEVKKKRLEEDSQAEESRKKILAQELDWMRQAPKARMGKNKARISAYENLLAESQRETTAPTQIVIPAGPRLGTIVIEARTLKKSFSDHKVLFDNLTFQIPPGAIVGVIGSNGRGKSTLFRLITGHDTPDSGTLKLGETVVLGYVDQSRDSLDPTKTVWQEISDGQEEITLGKRSLHSRAYCALFQFRGSDQQKPVASLSGGERNRVHLAKTLKSGANVLLLDEPTNDLDLDTLRALETALLSFAGCALVISHDRWFLDRLATHILAFEGNGSIVWFEGNYQDYEHDLKTHRPHLLNTARVRKIF